MAIIEVEHVTKEYRLGAMQSLKTIAGRMLGRVPPDSSNFKALDDINFSIERGEVVGIIGHNGAGKSTLLKLLSGITTPTSGAIKVEGKIAPLIEVGAGLVGDMTGRENIYLNASILGMNRSSIEKIIDDIISFSELEKFIDTPIKRYSSGMQVRLGYSIATAINAQILIVDEVLAVGDMAFQRKSIERMQRLINDQKSTVLIVGHNIRQLERICTRMIMLDHGKIIMDSDPITVTNAYFEIETENENTRIKNKLQTTWTHQSSGELHINSIKTLNINGLECKAFEVEEDFIVELEINSTIELEAFDIGIAIHTADLAYIGISVLTGSLHNKPTLTKGLNKLRCLFRNMKILPGLFMFRVGIKDMTGQLLWNGENISPFKITIPKNANASRYSSITFIEFSSTWECNGLNLT